MDFDFELIASPFRMQPGLRRLAVADRHLTPLRADSAIAREKRQVLQGGTARLAVAGFDPAPALAAVRDQAALDGVPDSPATVFPELAVEEDLAVLDGDTGTLPWLCVCLPSHWSPEDKLGLDFASVHRPVADNRLLIGAGRQLVSLATSGERWERHVWTISPSGRHDQHPRRQPRTPWPDTADVEAFANACFLRAERQTFFPVGRGTRQAVFTIRVMLEPLAVAVDTARKAQLLQAGLASMSPEVLRYKGLEDAREPLLQWLAARTA
ncbi:MAG TPA: heme-dependent oxidative N-demethylase subunit alpha family protein [Ramlibacter sp.]|uniref:heme-dependent oxidative N-demethylase subunit alpha family protein n=1 Tax=Ramlibacter sp. TaxID=1917967 RepID=UPI002D3C5A7B|nr:heme-dependent oxidative N-demethylase subunit alpha family protein [Ramlibacter sp.]HZY19424.1 heme-dependent oxidative N-demethylase subunit alpha family protein [Ramlibacter sp.]